ncbi:MAG TPA: carboxypeptidase regulatory-like domain-containing protein [Pyrinomonadaceae bacterium]|nr:carboxypeptidase regulatory-like domain-containing protein [Pyrinomonadaceae bacterium]
MHRKYFLISLAAVAVLLLSNIAVSAQVGQLRGRVMLKQADGTSTPVEGAIVDVFRTDLPGKYETKTKKKGEFVFAGLPYVGTYIISVSAPNAQPNFLPNIKVGRDIDYEITLDPGNGRRLTQEEARSLAAGSAPSGGGGERAEDRAKREELMRKNAEIEAKNKKILEANEIVARTFKAGNEALMAKRYDEAITQYDEGLVADPEQIALLTNKSIALRARGVERYNAAIQSKDDSAKTSGLEAARKDFRESAEAATKAAELAKAQPAPTEPAAQASLNSNKLAALSARAEAMRLFVTKGDPSQADAGIAAFQEYIAAESDPAKKAKAQIDAGNMLLDAGQATKALDEFQKVLAADPENVDATLGAGLALFQTGEKTNFQEAANYLQRFVDKAPDTHSLKSSAKEALDYLKSQENIKPEKITPAAGGRRRRG